jgi:hypothetical protein
VDQDRLAVPVLVADQRERGGAFESDQVSVIANRGADTGAGRGSGSGWRGRSSRSRSDLQRPAVAGARSGKLGSTECWFSRNATGVCAEADRATDRIAANGSTSSCAGDSAAARDSTLASPCPTRTRAGIAAQRAPAVQRSAEHPMRTLVAHAQSPHRCACSSQPLKQGPTIGSN